MTQVRFGAAAVKSLSSRSPARLPSVDGIVVRMPLGRRIRCRPRARIARCTLSGDAFGVLRRARAVIGAGAGAGATRNLPLPAGTGDGLWVAAVA